MAYPSDIDTFPAGSTLHVLRQDGSVNPNPPTGTYHSDLLGRMGIAISAIESQVGIPGSAVTTTLDYLLKNSASSDPGHKHSVASITGLGSAALQNTSAFDAAGAAFAALSSALAALAAFTGTSNIVTVGTLSAGSIPYSLLTGTPSIPAGANPTGTVGLTAVNGSATTFLRSDGAPALSQAIAPTWTGQHTFSTVAPIFGTMTAGSVLFAGTAGLLSQDNANLFWDDTNNRLGIGTASPGMTLHLIGAYGVGTNAPGVASTYALNNVVQGSNAKSVASNENILFLGSSDAAASFPTGLLVRIRGGASTAVRQAHIQSTEIGLAVNILLLQPDGGNLGIGLASGIIPAASLHATDAAAKTSAANHTAFLAGSNETAASNPLGVTIGYYGGASVAARKGWVQATEVGSNANELLLQPSGGFAGVGPYFTDTLGALWHIRIGTATHIGQIIKGAPFQSANLLELQNSSGTPYVTVGPPTLGSANTSNFLLITGTLPTSQTNYSTAVNCQITSASAGTDKNQYAFNMNLLAGGTSDTIYAAGRFVTTAAGVGNDSPNNYNGYFNAGIFAYAEGLTAGHNIGVSGLAYASTTANIGVLGNANQNANGAANIGVWGNSINAGTSPIHVGGYFGLQNATPTFASAALCADNGATTSPIELGRDNGSVVKTLYDGGGMELGAGTTTPGKSRIKLSGGTAITTGDVALSGWGAGATVSAVTGNDSRGTITITTSVLDTPSLNPTATLTFKDGTFTDVPFALANMNNDGTGVGAFVQCKTTATTLVIKFLGTPTALTAATYIFNYLVEG